MTPVLLRRLLPLLALTIASLAGCSQTSIAADPVATQPQTYRLADVRIVVNRYPGNGPVPLKRISLSGSGEATVECGKTVYPSAIGSEAMMTVLNEVYRIRFFELPTSYATRYSVFLKDDETVVRSATRMADASSTSICVTLGAFEKCVIFPNDGPPELAALAELIFAQADEVDCGL